MIVLFQKVPNLFPGTVNFYCIRCTTYFLSFVIDCAFGKIIINNIKLLFYHNHGYIIKYEKSVTINLKLKL